MGGAGRQVAHGQRGAVRPGGGTTRCPSTCVATSCGWRALQSTGISDSRPPEKIFFSPDGRKYASPIAVHASAVDLAAGKLVPGPTTFHRFIGSRGRPEWSPDGKQLVYQSCAPLGSGPCTMWIRSMENGQLRELKLQLKYFFFPRWSPDGRELIVRGTDMRGRNIGLYRIDVHTGETALVATPYPGHTMPQWGADSTHVYYRRDSSLIARNRYTASRRHHEVRFGSSPRRVRDPGTDRRRRNG